MQVEDVMLINEKRIVALEYIFYNKEGNYSKIKRVRKTDKVDDQIGFEEYHHEGEKVNPHSAFNNEPVKYHDSKVDYIEQHLMTEA